MDTESQSQDLVEKRVQRSLTKVWLKKESLQLEIIIISEVSQKDKYHMISLICGI